MLNLTINGQLADIDTAFQFRLNRFESSDDGFVRGGDTSTSMSLPKTKRNNLIFKAYTQASTGKFARNGDYTAVLSRDGVELLRGRLSVTQIDKSAYQVEILGVSVDWVSKIDGKTLQDLGVVNGQPTWLQPYEGYISIDDTNKKNNTQTDAVFPTIGYNNTPITDYLDFNNTQIFGSYDGSGNQITAPMDFPNFFRLRPFFWGQREGLTFEDFPPAIFYSNIIRKIFSDIGYQINGDIFNTEWFNSLIMPFVGNEPAWNWKTLAQLQANLTDRGIDTTIGEAEINRNVLSGNGVRQYTYAVLNSTFSDDINSRLDRVYNFKKGFVDDITAKTGGQYICPVDGRYKIRIKSNIIMDLDCPSPGAIGGINFTNFNPNNPNYGFDDVVLIITRRDISNDFVYFPTSFDEQTDQLQQVASWMSQDNVDFVNNPSDIIAYISPKRAGSLGITNRQTCGSPLTNYTETVNVNSFNFFSTLSSTNVNIDADVDIDIELDLKKNERLNAYWLILRGDPVNLAACSLEGNINNDGISLFEVDYLCGTEDLNLAANLPPISQKDFISSFIKRWNLRFQSNEDNTLTFYYDKLQNNSVLRPIDITDRVVENSEVYSPLTPYYRQRVNYNNDNNDRLLTRIINNCNSETTETLNYANYDKKSDKQFNRNELTFVDIFSATLFERGNFVLTDVSTLNPTLVSASDPTTGEVIKKGFLYTPPTATPYNFDVPNIMSRQQYNAALVQDLEYLYDYTPRLLYYLGTANQHFGISEDLRIKTGSPQEAFVLNLDTDFWLQPTVCAFDQENNNPYPSLRYDTSIFPQYHEDYIEKQLKSDIFIIEVFLTPEQWNNLKSWQYIKYQGITYKVLEIQDFDYQANVATKIKTIRVI